MLNEEKVNQTFNRLKNHPEILESIKELLDITESCIEKADDAEFALIPEVRGLEKKCLKDWSQQRAVKREEAKKENLRQHSKKN
jgi:hypothetical protein